VSTSALAWPKFFRKLASVAVVSTTFASVVALAQDTPNAIPNFEGAINVQDEGNANEEMIRKIQGTSVKQIPSLKFPGSQPTSAQMLSTMEANNVRRFKLLLDNQETLAISQETLSSNQEVLMG
jgi:hypothetical protein